MRRFPYCALARQSGPPDAKFVEDRVKLPGYN
jgi:hypothetical protein